ncbi:unnamed protein product, partial [Heterosigma akashiwo]
RSSNASKGARKSAATKSPSPKKMVRNESVDSEAGLRGKVAPTKGKMSRARIESEPVIKNKKETVPQAPVWGVGAAAGEEEEGE